jgi:hypothetical protein
VLIVGGLAPPLVLGTHGWKVPVSKPPFTIKRIGVGVNVAVAVDVGVGVLVGDGVLVGVDVDVGVEVEVGVTVGGGGGPKISGKKTRGPKEGVFVDVGVAV